MWYRLPVGGRDAVGHVRRGERCAPHHDCGRHAGLFMGMTLREVWTRLHLDEGAPCRVADHGDAVPCGTGTEGLYLDVGDESDLGTDVGKNLERGVRIVGLTAAASSIAAVVVACAFSISHQVDHPNRSVILSGGGRELTRIVTIDRAVSRCHAGVVLSGCAARVISSRATIGPAFWFWPVTRRPSTTQ